MRSLRVPSPYLTGTALVILASVVTSGCGGSSRCVAHGAVTLDGEPVDGAAITFFPEDATQGRPAGGFVRKGRYTVTFEDAPATASYRVEIAGLRRKTGNKVEAPPPSPPGTLIEETVEAIPECYNHRTTLRVELRRGDNRHDFTLQSEAEVKQPVDD